MKQVTVTHKASGAVVASYNMDEFKMIDTWGSEYRLFDHQQQIILWKKRSYFITIKEVDENA